MKDTALPVNNNFGVLWSHENFIYALVQAALSCRKVVNWQNISLHEAMAVLLPRNVSQILKEEKKESYLAHSQKKKKKLVTRSYLEYCLCVYISEFEFCTKKRTLYTGMFLTLFTTYFTLALKEIAYAPKRAVEQHKIKLQGRKNPEQLLWNSITRDHFSETTPEICQKYLHKTMQSKGSFVQLVLKIYCIRSQ